MIEEKVRFLEGQVVAAAVSVGETAGNHARRAGGRDVSGVVSDHDGPGGIDAELFGRFQERERRRLPFGEGVSSDEDREKGFEFEGFEDEPAVMFRFVCDHRQPFMGEMGQHIGHSRIEDHMVGAVL